jgi:malonyl-CoA decarboxylase
MVNYRYEIRDIERNHEAYENDGTVAASKSVHALLKPERSRTDATSKLLQLPGLRTIRTAPPDTEQSR